MNRANLSRAQRAALFSVLVLSTAWPVAAQGPSAPAVGDARLAELLAGDDPRDPAELLAMQRHVQALVQRVLPATVALPGASGVIVRRGDEHFVLCAAHVTGAANQAIEIRTTDGEVLRGTSLGADHRSDVSLIRIDSVGEPPAVEVGRSSELRRGQWVLMLGHPSGRKEGRDAPVRLGRVLDVPADGYLVTDCTMQGGDSGGPLFDMDGRVVGINSRISRNLAMNMHAPIDALVGNWQELQEGKVTEPQRRGRPARVEFGVPLEYGDGCPVFGEVPKDGPSARAGLRTGDRLFEIDGAEVQSRRSVAQALRAHQPGGTVRVVVERDGRGLELELPLVGGGVR